MWHWATGDGPWDGSSRDSIARAARVASARRAPGAAPGMGAADARQLPKRSGRRATGGWQMEVDRNEDDRLGGEVCGQRNDAARAPGSRGLRPRLRKGRRRGRPERREGGASHGPAAATEAARPAGETAPEASRTGEAAPPASVAGASRDPRDAGGGASVGRRLRRTRRGAPVLEVRPAAEGLRVGGRPGSRGREGSELALAHAPRLDARRDRPSPAPRTSAYSLSGSGEGRASALA